MAKKPRSNGHDAVLCNAILADIRELIRGTNERLDRVEVRLGRMEGEVTARLDRLDNSVEKLSGRIETILSGPFGEMVREHGSAIEELRSRVAMLEHGRGS